MWFCQIYLFSSCLSTSEKSHFKKILKSSDPCTHHHSQNLVDTAIFIINNDRKTHNFFSVPLVITEEQAPRTQMFPEGGSARIKCAPQGEVSVSWMDRNNARIEASRKIYYFIQLQQFLHKCLCSSGNCQNLYNVCWPIWQHFIFSY